MHIETIVFAIGVLFWIVSSLIKGFKWLVRQTNPTPPPQAPPPSQPGFQTPGQFSTSAPSPVRPQTPFSAPPPSRPSPVQAFQQQAARLEQARLMPRQPPAGGPAVSFETDRQDFERQETDLFASEPSSLGVSLSSPAPRPAAAPNRLFNGTDDLVRAIILQEVLGPPLSRRNHSPSSTPPAHTPS